MPLVGFHEKSNRQDYGGVGASGRDMTKKDEAGVLDLSDFGATEAKLVGFPVNSAELHLLHKILARRQRYPDPIRRRRRGRGRLREPYGLPLA
jgi:hypothetical protein